MEIQTGDVERKTCPLAKDRHRFSFVRIEAGNPAIDSFGMKLKINGETREFNSPVLLSGLIEQLGMKPDRVAIELNRNIAPRDQWATIQLAEGDQLEIVHFVGGGWH